METHAAERWLGATLKADGQLAALVGTRIYNTRRPADAALPCVIFQLQTPGADFLGVGAVRIWTPLLYLVYGLAEQESYAGVLASIAGRIDAVLHGQSGSNDAGTIWACVRQRPFRAPEVFAGREYRKSGGFYDMRVR